MAHLLKLEWKKNQLTGYLKFVGISIITIFIVTSLMAVGSNNQEEVMFTGFTAFMSLVNIFIRIVFVIFSGVLLSRLVVDEYKNKTIQVLFTYPINRKKVMKSKLAIVLGYCFFSIVLATLSVGLLTFLFNPMLHLFPEKMTLAMIVKSMPSTLINALMTACLSLIPLYFGMRKQSSATTITMAVLIGFLVNATVSDGSSSLNLNQMIVVPTILSIVGLAVGYVAYYKIEATDIG